MGKHWTSTLRLVQWFCDGSHRLFYMAIETTLFISDAAEALVSLDNRTMNRIYKDELCIIPALWESGMRGWVPALPCIFRANQGEEGMT